MIEKIMKCLNFSLWVVLSISIKIKKLFNHLISPSLSEKFGAILRTKLISPNKFHQSLAKKSFYTIGFLDLILILLLACTSIFKLAHLLLLRFFTLIKLANILTLFFAIIFIWIYAISYTNWRYQNQLFNMLWMLYCIVTWYVAPKWMPH
jgi:hypothetical protein